MSESAAGHHAVKRARDRALLAALLVLALLGAQGLGLWHRMVHFGPAHAAGPGLVQATVGNPAQAPGLLAPLFSDHHDDADCQLFDQSAHADAIHGVATVAMAQVPLPGLVRVSHALALARWHALFQARGPPVVR
jgi:hypothetical protein